MRFLALSFNPRLFLYLVLGFILCTIVGTVSHELGHCAVAKAYNYDVQLHYASINYSYAGKQKEAVAFRAKHREAIDAKKSPEYARFKDMVRTIYKEQSLITIGGPLQTIATGTIGFLVLWFARKRIYNRAYLTITEWIAVLLAFFWSRQVFNFLFSIPDFLTSEKIRFSGDEPSISRHLGLPAWTFGLATFIPAVIILTWVTFRLIPLQQRLTFILAGLIGSALGWYIWMYWVGPVVLP